MMNGSDPREVLRMLIVGDEEYRRVSREQRERLERAGREIERLRKRRAELLQQFKKM